LYTIVIKGKPQGPYTLEQLKKMEIFPDTFVRKPGMDDYKEAHELQELRELLGFNVPKHSPQYFASFDQRLMAWAIDYFLIVVVYAIILAIAVLFIEDQEARIALVVAFFMLVPFTKFVYCSIADASKIQGSIGKKLMDIKVTNDFGQRLGLGTALLRNICKIVSNATLGFGYIYCFLNKKQQCLHDVIVGTLVVKDRLL
jgi:uncharacterized RDD family membrane protein YckC